MKIVTLLTTAVLAPAMFAADAKVKMENLPAAVQASVREQTKGATLVGLGKEVEKGRGAVQKVEKVTQGSTVTYEAAIKSKSGKTPETLVNADGSPHKK